MLTFDDPSEGYFLWRFMIAEEHQRRGIGRRALEQVLDALARARRHGGEDQRGAVEHGRDPLYESLGFRLTGEEEHGELVMGLEM